MRKFLLTVILLIFLCPITAQAYPSFHNPIYQYDPSIPRPSSQKEEEKEWYEELENFMEDYPAVTAGIVVGGILAILGVVFVVKSISQIAKTKSSGKQKNKWIHIIKTLLLTVGMYSFVIFGFLITNIYAVTYLLDYRMGLAYSAVATMFLMFIFYKICKFFIRFATKNDNSCDRIIRDAGLMLMTSSLFYLFAPSPIESDVLGTGSIIAIMCIGGYMFFAHSLAEYPKEDNKEMIEKSEEKGEIDGVDKLS